MRCLHSARPDAYGKSLTDGRYSAILFYDIGDVAAMTDEGSDMAQGQVLCLLEIGERDAG